MSPPPKYYQTDKFKKLNEKWYKKLEKSGFDDIEQADDYLKSWHNHKFSRTDSSVREAKETYYRLASQFLNEHKFENKTDYIIWEQHCKGVSFADIDKMIDRKLGKARRVIDKLKETMKSKWKKDDSNGQD